MRTKLSLLYFFSIFFYFFSLNLSAQNTVLQLSKNQNEYINIGSHIDIFEDESSNLKLDEVKKQKFEPSKQDVINKGFKSTPTFWLRVIVDNTVGNPEKEWIFSVKWPVLSYISLHYSEAGKNKTFQAGEALPFEARPINHRNFAFPIGIKPGSIDTFYFEIKSYTPNVYPINLETVDQWRENNSLDDILLAGFFGALFIMFIYNVFLYISVRDSDYIPYICYMVLMGILIMSMRGVGFQLFFQDNYWANIMARNGAAAAAGFCIGWFTRVFLHLKEKAPVMDRLLLISQYIWAAVFTLVLFNFPPLFPTGQIVADIALNLFAAIHPILAFTSGIIVLRQGYKPAKFFLTGFSFLLGGIVIQVLKNLGVFNQNLYTEYSFQYGVLIEQALLSIALGDKINVMKEEKEAAQDNVISALQENERIISEQNQFLEIKVQERTYELNEANEELQTLNEEIRQTLDYVSHQNEIIEEKNKDITESIQYAWRIQNAILPEIETIKRYIPEFVVFYRPKDIVSGDFFWFARNELSDITFIATVDCTGHGVPGAFMSVIGYNILNRIVIENGIIETDQILSMLDKGVRQSLKQDQISDKKTHDGMDLTLVAIHHKTKQVFFSGAQTTLYKLSKGDIELYKGDKFPVGGAQTELKTFTSTHILIEPGDRIYLFTDGVVDQFGGPNKRKFTPKRLQQMLLNLQEIKISEQSVSIIQTLDEWKSDIEQIDDMTLIGISPI